MLRFEVIMERDVLHMQFAQTEISIASMVTVKKMTKLHIANVILDLLGTIVQKRSITAIRHLVCMALVSQNFWVTHASVMKAIKEIGAR